MTKQELITENNKNVETLQQLVSEYNELSGSSVTIQHCYMAPFWMSNMKSSVERQYMVTLNMISEYREKVEAEKGKKEMLKSEEGKNFIDSLKKKDEELNQQCEEIRQHFIDSFNKVLEGVGLNWEIIPTYNFTLTNAYNYMCFGIRCKDWKRACMRVYLYHRGSWTMELGMGMYGNQSITSKDLQYNQYKAMVTICDNDKIFTDYINTTFQELVKKSYDINNQIIKNDEIMENPYKVWKSAMTKCEK